MDDSASDDGHIAPSRTSRFHPPKGGKGGLPLSPPICVDVLCHTDDVDPLASPLAGGLDCRGSEGQVQELSQRCHHLELSCQQLKRDLALATASHRAEIKQKNKELAHLNHALDAGV